MAAFWDVLWTDTKAALILVAPMLLLSLPASVIGVLLGAWSRSLVSWRQLRRMIGRGVLVGTGAAFVLSMIVQFSLAAEGLPLAFGRRALGEEGSLHLILLSPAIAFLGAYLLTRRLPLAAIKDPRRSYTLRQLFVGQLIVGLVLGWWAYTRRSELGQRKQELSWQAREQSLTAIFGPYGWYVKTWHDKDDIALWQGANPAPQVVTDATLDLVVRQGNIVELDIKSDAVTDDGLRRLATSKGIKILEVTSNQLTDDGIHAVSQIPGLETLVVDSPGVTLAGLKQMPKSTSLQFVQVRRLVLTRAEYFDLMASQPDIGWSIEWKE
jgi:hypothetical protein